MAQKLRLHSLVRTSPTLLLNLLLTTPGQINASLTSFSRTVDDYNKLAKQEIQQEKQQKAYERIKNFRSELSEYRDRFDRLKQELDERVSPTTYQRQLSNPLPTPS
jgi:DNA repair exonuclease SbcCD ATPase subunit